MLYHVVTPNNSTTEGQRVNYQPVDDCLSGLEKSSLPDKIDLQKVDDLLYTVVSEYLEGE